MNTNSNFELLVDRVDGLQSASEANLTDLMIAENPDVAIEYAQVQSVIFQIREAGIYEQIAGIRKTYELENIGTAPKAKVVRFNFSRAAFRVAATILIVLASATVYKYLSVSNSGVYNEYYSTYELNTSRSQSKSVNIETAYKNKEWQKVIELAGASAPTNKELFLKGMAEMELKSFELAIASFTQVISNAYANGDDYFVDEAEYYQALGYLGANRGNEALVLLNKIKGDSQHLFNPLVKRMNLDLKVLGMKH